MIALWIVLGLLVLIIPGLLYTWNLSGKIYTNLLVRETPEKWGRNCSFPEDEEYVKMYEQGLVWGETHKDRKRPVSVVSDGFHLYGEYFDFGAEKAVIIIPGRTEACPYSYFFAEPYRECGCNVLVIDNRAHGLSEGKYPSLGFSEYRDILQWGKLLHDELKNSQVFLHGICIGASTALFALTDQNCPDYMAGMVGDGMYTTFYESFKEHMRIDHHPIFPVGIEVMAQIYLHSKARPATDGPIKRIGRMKKPILFVHSREDGFSLPEKAQQLYDKCGSSAKKIRFFDHGAHSRVRINDPEGYDRAVMDFVASVTA